MGTSLPFTLACAGRLAPGLEDRSGGPVAPGLLGGVWAVFLLACYFYKVYFIFFPGEVMQVSPASFLFEINHIYEAYIIYFHQEVIFTASTSFIFIRKSYLQRLRHLFLSGSHIYSVYVIYFYQEVIFPASTSFIFIRKPYFQRLRHLFLKKKAHASYMGYYSMVCTQEGR
jgi:hypothetical protein